MPAPVLRLVPPPPRFVWCGFCQRMLGRIDNPRWRLHEGDVVTCPHCQRELDYEGVFTTVSAINPEDERLGQAIAAERETRWGRIVWASRNLWATLRHWARR